MQETQETQVQSLDQEDPQEEEMATHSSILAWEIPWTEELGGPEPLGWQRVRPDLVTKQGVGNMGAGCSFRLKEQRITYLESVI